MKKYILLNLTGLFVFFLFTCMLISCGKSGKSKPETEESSKPPTTTVGPKATQFTMPMVVEAFKYAANKLPEEQRGDFLEESPIGELYDATEKVNRAVHFGELKVSETTVSALGEAIYEKSKERYGPGYRARVNRVKCVNNLGQITKSFIGFSGDWDGRLPWQLSGPDKEAAFGKAGSKHLGTILAHPLMTAMLGSPKILLSPCDPDRAAANEKVQENWRSYDSRKGKPIPHEAISYGVCLGADLYAPETILGITRNISGEDLKGAKFMGNVMKGLEAGQGQMSLTDGSTRLMDNAALAESIARHSNAKDGSTPGPPSTKLMLPK